MADLPESNEWAAGVYQLETSDPVLGGPEGIDNLQAKQLASRTRWLKGKTDELGDALANKADKAATLSGYNIGDAFTKPETSAAIQQAIAALVASSPAALDTLKELAEALGNDPNFATTMANALAGKAAKATTLSGYNIGDAFTKPETTAAIQNAIGALVASSPAALDTLKELAEALGNDPNFATTITNALAAKAPLADPKFTGTPTAPTAVAGSNNKLLATTEYVDRANAALDPWSVFPIGVPIPVMAGAGEPPTNKPYRYIKLTYSDPYNAGVLTGEVLTGVAPLVVSYARISVGGSPITGNTVYLLNTERRSIRPGVAGSLQDDALQNITGAINGSMPTASVGGATPVGAIDFQPSNYQAGAGIAGTGILNLTFDASRVARTSNETRTKNIGANLYMRVL